MQSGPHRQVKCADAAFGTGGSPSVPPTVRLCRV